MGLIGGVARTAVVAGTATAVSGRVRRRQAGRFAERDAETAAQRTAAYQNQVAAQPQAAPPPAAPAPAAPAPAAPDLVAQLKSLGELRDQGILTDEEFAAQKARLLAR